MNKNHSLNRISSNWALGHAPWLRHISKSYYVPRHVEESISEKWDGLSYNDILFSDFAQKTTLVDEMEYQIQKHIDK